MRTLGKLFIGLLAAVGAMVLVLGLIVASLMPDLDEIRPRKATLPAAMVVSLRLDGPLPEQMASPFAALTGDGLTLARTVAAIDRAARDPAVRGLAVTFAGPLGMAQAQELRNAVAAFRQTGKPALAFADSFGLGPGTPSDYYLAAAFSEVWMQPSGLVNLSGFGLEVPFLRDGLAGLGIEAEVSQRWEYKNAFDPATRQQMTEPHRASLRRLLESWRVQVRDGVAEDRGLSPERAAALLAGPPLLAAEAAEAGLISRLGYWDEVVAALRDQTGTDALVSLHTYAANRPDEAPSDAPAIALIEAVGVVGRRGGKSDPLGRDSGLDADRVAKAIRDAVADKAVRAIVVRVDSPGGSYTAADAVWREVRRAGEAKVPVVVSFGDMAASGGYFLSMPAAKIVAQPGTVTGSIGVVGIKPVLSGLWSKLDINWESVALGDYALMWSTNRAFTEAQRAVFDRMMDAAYADFTAKLGEGRRLTAQQVDQVARGRVWSGADAKVVGLVDALGGLNEAVALAKAEAGLPEEAAISLRPFPARKSGLEALFALVEEGEMVRTLDGLAGLAGVLGNAARLTAPVLEQARQAETTGSGPAMLAPLPSGTGGFPAR